MTNIAFNSRKLHFFTGVIIVIFIALHLFNHVCSIRGAEVHISVMNTFRIFYRNVVAESILLVAVIIQISTGIVLFRKSKRSAIRFFDKLQRWTGLYLAIFFLIHLGAVFTGRYLLHLDTNFYFGVAGLNTFPFNLFFIPYYGFAVISFFGHIAAIHNKKMTQPILGFTPQQQAMLILVSGIVFTILLLWGLTNHFNGVKIPAAYNILVGK